MRPASQTETPSLYIHEWLAVICMGGLLLFLTLVALRNPAAPPLVDREGGHFVVEPTLRITVEGFVENPGLHSISRGSSVRDALALAKPLPEADLSKLKLDSKLRKGQTLRIPSRHTVTFRIEGLGTFKVPRGTRLNELSKHVKLPKGIDKDVLRSRRQIKEGETLILPFKNI